MSLAKIRRSKLWRLVGFVLVLQLLTYGPARAAIVPVTPGIDWREIIVGLDGSPVGTVSNPLFTSVTGAGSGGTSSVDESVWTAAVSAFNPGGGVFNDSAAALTSGQQGELRMTPNRAQHVNLRNQAGTEIGTVANPLNVTVSGGGSATSVSAADEAAWTAGTSLFNPDGGVFNDSAAALTTGQQGTFRATPNRAIHTNLRNQAGTEVGTSGAPLRVDPTGTTPQPVTGTFFQATQPVSGTVTGNQGTQGAGGSTGAWFVQGAQGISAPITSRPNLIAGENGGNVTQIHIASTGDLIADQGAAGSAGASGWPIQGQSAIGGALAGLPVSVGILDASSHVQVPGNAPLNTGTTGTNLLGAAPQGLAVALGSNPTASAAGQYASQVQTRGGIPFFLGGHPNIITSHLAITAAQTNTILVANTAGTKLVITGLTFTCSNANTVNVAVYIGLGQTTTPTTTGVIMADGVIANASTGVAPGSGISRGNGGGVLGEGADGDQLFITCTVPTSGDCDCVFSYFTTPS